MERIVIFTACPAYAYLETEGKLADEMLETHLDHTYIAGTKEEAIRMAVRWSKDRFDNYIADVYNQSFFSSLKVRIGSIGRIDDDGKAEGHSGYTFFEWKYDFPDPSLESFVDAFCKKDGMQDKIELIS